MEGASENTLLQVPITEFQLKERLALTIETSEKTKKGSVLVNCANLVIVLLGLVTNPKLYLIKCFDRKAFTETHELNTIVTEAFGKANVKYKGNTYTSIIDNAIVTELKERVTYGVVLNAIGNELKNGYATPIGLTFTDESQHLAVLRKDVAGRVELIDPQSVDNDGSYPLRRIIYPVLNVSPYKNPLTNIIHFAGPILPMSKHANAKSTLSENVMHETYGGKRKPRKGMTRKRKRKTHRF